MARANLGVWESGVFDVLHSTILKMAAVCAKKYIIKGTSRCLIHNGFWWNGRVLFYRRRTVLGGERVTLFPFSTEVPAFDAFKLALWEHAEEAVRWGVVLLCNTRVKTPKLLLWCPLFKLTPTPKKKKKKKDVYDGVSMRLCVCGVFVSLWVCAPKKDALTIFLM